MSKIKYCPRCGCQLEVKVNHCPECGLKIERSNHNNDQSHGSKKEKFLKGKSKNNKNIYWYGGIAITIIMMIVIFKPGSSKEEQIIKNQPKVEGSVSYPSSRTDFAYTLAFSKADKVILPLNEVKEKKMVKFDYNGSNGTISILAYLAEDGKVITAISMCEPCNSTDFHINGSNLICNSCGTTWNLNDLKAISGSCGKYPPDPLPSIVVGNEIQINKSLVENWKRRV